LSPFNSRRILSIKIAVLPDPAAAENI